MHDFYSLYTHTYTYMVIYLGMPALARSLVVIRFFIGADDDDVQDLRFNWFRLSGICRRGNLGCSYCYCSYCCCCWNATLMIMEMNFGNDSESVALIYMTIAGGGSEA